MNIGFLLHLGLLAQEHAGSKRPFSFVGRAPLDLVWRIRNGVATNSLFLCQGAAPSMTSQLVQPIYTRGLLKFLLLCSSLYFIMYVLSLLAPEKVREDF